MAGWIGLLKSVPWGEVVGNAPKIAEGAKSLWSKVSNKIRPGDGTPAPDTDAGPETPLASRIAVLEDGQRELRGQLATSSDLIRSLAEQNAQLVVRLDALQRRQRWLVLALLALAVAGAWALTQGL